MSDQAWVKVEQDGGVAVVTIDRQEKLNALNAEVISSLGDCLRAVRDDDGVRGVILTGAGRKAFVAGADIAELEKMDALTGVKVSRQGQDVFRMIETFPKPVLAAVGGFALGGGCELALACHVRIASANARFGLPEVTLGIIPGYGGTLRLSRIVGLGRAVAMVLTGDMVGAEEALAMGLVSRVVPQEDLLASAREMMDRIVRNGPVALRLALESLQLAQEASTEDALRFESALFGLLASTEDMREGMRAFLEKRRPDFRGR